MRGPDPQRSNAARLFGYDIFISFALGPPPRGSRSYASDLARKLSERDFTVFFSEEEAPVGAELEDTLRRALHRSRILVVVVNVGTLVDPRWVRTEVEEFRRRHPERPIISVNIGGALQDPGLAAAAEPWLRFTDKIWIDESQRAGDEGVVSDGVIDRLVTAPNAMRSRTRWRWTVRAAFALLSVVTAAALWFAWSDRQNAQRANLAAEVATVRGLTSQSDLFRTQALATAPGWASLLHQSALLAIEARRRRPDRDNARALRAAADVLSVAPRVLDLPVEALRGVSDRADRLAMASANGAALDIREVATGRIVTSIPTVASEFGAYFSPDNTCLLVLNGNRVSAWQLHDAGSATELWAREAAFPNQPHRARVAFTANAQTVALIDGTAVVLLEAGTGRDIRRFQHDEVVTEIAFSGDGRRLASASGNTGTIFTVSTGAAVRVLHPGAISLLALDEGGTRLATVGGRHIEVWDATTADRLATLNVLPGSDDVAYIARVAFDETGGRLGVVGEDGSGLQINLARLTETEIGATYTDTQWLVGLNPRFLGYRADGSIEVWDLPAGQPVARAIHHGGSDDGSGPSPFLYAPEAHRFVLFDERRLWIYDTRLGTETSSGSFGVAKASETLVSAQRGFTSQYAGVVPVSLSRDGGVLFAADRGGTTRIWNVADLREIWSANTLQAAALSPDGRLVVGAGPDGAMRAWDVASGKEAWHVAGVNARVTVKDEDGDDILRPAVLSLGFSDDGRQVVAWLLNRKLRAFEASDGRELTGGPAAQASGMSWDAAPLETVSPDGTLRAAVNGSEVRISRIDGNRELAIVRHDADPDANRNSVVALSFSPDGRFLVTGGQDRTARVWDLTGQELALVRHDAPLVAVAFAAHGDRVVTAGADRRLHTWMWRDAELEAHICGRLTRNLTPDEWRHHLGETPHSATCPTLPLLPK